MKYDEKLNEIIKRYHFDYKGVISSTLIHANMVDIFTERCTGKNVAIWGVGKKNTVNSHAAVILKKYVLNLNGLKCLVDSSPDIQGTNFMGYPVIAPDELKKEKIDIVIIGSRASAKAIAKNIESVYPGCEYIDIYEELRKKGIVIDYNFFSDHNMYTELYDLRIKYENALEENKSAALKELIAGYLSIRDFYYAEKFSLQYIEKKYDDYLNIEKMFAEIKELQNEIIQVNSKKKESVCIHLLDSLRAIDVFEKKDNDTVKFKMFEKYRDNAIAFTKAYSTGPTTYESMLAVIKQKMSYEEDVYDNNFMFKFNEFELLEKMKKQGKKIIFYIAKDYYIMEPSSELERKEHLHMTEKLWNVSCDIAESDVPVFAFIYCPWELHYPLLPGYCRNKPQIHHFSDVGIDDMSDFIQDQFEDCKNYVDQQYDYYKEMLGSNTVNVFMGDHSQPVFDAEHKNYPFYMFYNDPDKVSHVAFFISANSIQKQDYTEMISMINFNQIMDAVLCKKSCEFPKTDVIQYQYYNIQNKKMREVAQENNFWDYTEGIQCFLSKDKLYVITATGKEEIYIYKNDNWVLADMDANKEYIKKIKDRFDVNFPEFWTRRFGKI